MKKLAVVTGTRAEYGILKPLINEIFLDKELDLNLIVTGSHLDKRFGETISEILDDGFPVRERVDIEIDSDSDQGILETIARAIPRLGESFLKTSPDIIILLGDRYEILAAATAAYVLRIPIAHIAGGETTEGAIDEAFRHSITKMASLHFPSTEEYRKRIVQLGESPNMVFLYGYLGLEGIKDMDFLNKEDLSSQLEFNFNKPFFLITYHPETLSDNSIIEELEDLFSALNDFSEYSILWTMANADAEGSIINDMVEKYALKNPTRVKVCESLGKTRYLSVMRLASAVLGNSSSGLLEAPEFKIPTVNIGNRQKGRTRATSVIDVDNSYLAIKNGVEKAISKSFRDSLISTINPYSTIDGKPSEKILDEIKKQLDKGIDLKKRFYNIEF